MIDFAGLATFCAQRRNIRAAWLFGSSQAGDIRPGGDTDIAIWFGERPGLDELTTLRADLQKLLHFDDIDLLILNGARPITRFEAVSGRLLFARDRNETAGFVSLTAREYEDSIAMLQRALAWRNN